MAIFDIEFKSFNERDMIQAWIYTPLGRPKGIIQVVHGLGEHSRRYLHMILKLNDAGYIVCADDHVGHGRTAIVNHSHGDFGDKGYMTAIEDEHKLYSIVSKKYPNLPYYFFGHSWGSMISRLYSSIYGDTLSGLVLCGTTGKLVMDTSKEGDPIATLFSSFLDRIDQPKTPNDWISIDSEIIEDYELDPLAGFGALSPQSGEQFAQCLLHIDGQEWADKLPKTLPVYNIAGDQDPVGNYGEGVYAVSNWLVNAGLNVKTKLYSGQRHEIVNHRDIRDEVIDGIIDFIDNLSK